MPAQAGIHGRISPSAHEEMAGPWTPASGNRSTGSISDLRQLRRGRRRVRCRMWRAAHMRGKLRQRSGCTRYTDNKDTIYAEALKPAFRQRESGRKALPREHIRRFICIEIIRRRGIGDARDADIAETVDREQRFHAGTFVPAREAQKVPDQPGPEQRPDMLEIGSNGRMHAGECGGWEGRSDSLLPSPLGFARKSHRTAMARARGRVPRPAVAKGLFPSAHPFPAVPPRPLSPVPSPRGRGG